MFPRSPSSTAQAMSASGVRLGGGHLVQPRDVRGADLPPTAPMTPEDVRFLLIHQSTSPNNYTAEQSTRYLHSFGVPPMC